MAAALSLCLPCRPGQAPLRVGVRELGRRGDAAIHAAPAPGAVRRRRCHRLPASLAVVAQVCPSCQPGPPDCDALSTLTTGSVATNTMQGSSGTADFTSGSGGRTGTAGFQPARSAGPGRGIWNVARMQRQLQSLGLAGVAAYGALSVFFDFFYLVSFTHWAPLPA